MLILKLQITLVFRGLLSENGQNTPVLKLNRQKNPEILPFSAEKNLLLHKSTNIFINVGQDFSLTGIDYSFFLTTKFCSKKHSLYIKTSSLLNSGNQTLNFDCKNCRSWKNFINPWIRISMFLCALFECATYNKTPQFSFIFHRTILFMINLFPMDMFDDASLW